jgi:hypothetical protein
MDRLAELFPLLVWEQIRPDLYRAEEQSEDPDTEPHWRFALIKGEAVASIMAVKEFAQTELDVDGIVERLLEYHATGRIH